MPLISYHCLNSSCDYEFKTYIRATKEIKESTKCEKCEGVAKRILSGPSTASKITIDNGVSAKAIEIYPDQVEVFKEHAKNNGEKPDA